MLEGDAVRTYGMIVGAKRRRRLGVGANAAIEAVWCCVLHDVRQLAATAGGGSWTAHIGY